MTAPDKPGINTTGSRAVPVKAHTAIIRRQYHLQKQT